MIKSIYESPLWGFKFTKGIGFWVGLNFTYGNLCVWFPFLMFYISLPKYFKRNYKLITVDKKYFWYTIHPARFGIYLDFQNYYGLRLPFFDVYLTRKKK